MAGSRVVQIARNRFAVPVMMHWELSNLGNLEPRSCRSAMAHSLRAAFSVIRGG